MEFERLDISKLLWRHPHGGMVLNKNQQQEIQLYIDELLAALEAHKDCEQ